MSQIDSIGAASELIALGKVPQYTVNIFSGCFNNREQNDKNYESMFKKWTL